MQTQAILRHLARKYGERRQRQGMKRWRMWVKRRPGTCGEVTGWVGGEQAILRHLARKYGEGRQGQAVGRKRVGVGQVAPGEDTCRTWGWARNLWAAWGHGMAAVVGRLSCWGVTEVQGRCMRAWGCGCRVCASCVQAAASCVAPRSVNHQLSCFALKDPPGSPGAPHWACNCTCYPFLNCDCNCIERNWDDVHGSSRTPSG